MPLSASLSHRQSTKRTERVPPERRVALSCASRAHVQSWSLPEELNEWRDECRQRRSERKRVTYIVKPDAGEYAPFRASLGLSRGLQHASSQLPRLRVPSHHRSIRLVSQLRVEAVSLHSTDGHRGRGWHPGRDWLGERCSNACTETLSAPDPESELYHLTEID